VKTYITIEPGNQLEYESIRRLNQQNSVVRKLLQVRGRDQLSQDLHLRLNPLIVIELHPRRKERLAIFRL
jgi:hypothetical protein